MALYKFSKRSQDKLRGVHVDLVRVCCQMLNYMDIVIIEGWRGYERQEQLVLEGKSHVHWPHSMHNHQHGGEQLSLAVDIAPYFNGRIPWEDWSQFAIMHQQFNKLFQQNLVDNDEDFCTRGFTLEWGGTWVTLKDGPHFQLNKIPGYQLPDEGSPEFNKQRDLVKWLIEKHGE